ncbi:conserved hypothetical protein [Hydrogenobacter thermophilus TK-6]|uniref:Uncharacterized protein n=1 Tax=Hydrogenobacter thermophilus (strain DSM 6534 / IAM 12695 / TK-6) TaxID=608538 RepID=D3DII5_HYDTT|nr:hypothetical protein [Hydrogenobacter thermophilus]ADO45563.1 conserved hypothetical protein [Hydrogenobacter thermophilus TK-6]BAI69637.1 hypothetical protein HTH_1183 [Hydrogenobacter thermophilus TK-6]
MALEEMQVEFLINPLKNRVWAVSMPDGELMDDIISIKRAVFCLESNEQYWLNPFGGSYMWTTKMSEPYEEEFVKFKKEAQQYMCIFDLSISDLQYMDFSPVDGTLLFDEEELRKKLSGDDYREFVSLMKELWEYVKED